MCFLRPLHVSYWKQDIEIFIEWQSQWIGEQREEEGTQDAPLRDLISFDKSELHNDIKMLQSDLQPNKKCLPILNCKR